MRVVPLQPDIAAPVRRAEPAPNAFTAALDAVAGALRRADAAETAYATGWGALQDAVLERARADVAVSIAAAAVQRTATSLQSVLNLQI